jgi:hypothetical protein
MMFFRLITGLLHKLLFNYVFRIHIHIILFIKFSFIWNINIGINPKCVLVTGDSAGGNLIFGIVLRCIHTGLRIPDGMVGSYPGKFRLNQTHL